MAQVYESHWPEKRRDAADRRGIPPGCRRLCSAVPEIVLYTTMVRLLHPRQRASRLARPRLRPGEPRRRPGLPAAGARPRAPVDGTARRDRRPADRRLRRALLRSTAPARSPSDSPRSRARPEAGRSAGDAGGALWQSGQNVVARPPTTIRVRAARHSGRMALPRDRRPGTRSASSRSFRPAVHSPAASPPDARSPFGECSGSRGGATELFRAGGLRGAADAGG